MEIQMRSTTHIGYTSHIIQTQREHSRAQKKTAHAVERVRRIGRQIGARNFRTRFIFSAPARMSIRRHRFIAPRRIFRV